MPKTQTLNPPLSSLEAREWFRSHPLWQLIKAELEARQAEQRRLCSTLEGDLSLRKSQGRCQELNDLLSGSLEAAVIAKLRRSESNPVA